MIVEMRTYTVLPDKLGSWLQLWQSTALPVQSEIIGGFLGMYLTEIGPVNEVVHLWRFDSLADREHRRAQLEQDPRWALYKQAVEQLGPITHMHSRIMKPTSFSPHLQTASGVT